MSEDSDDMTPEEREYLRLNELIGPLFDMTLRFEKAFARKAIDVIGLSDEDAEAAADMFKDEAPSGLGSLFAYLLRHVRFERLLRGMAAQFEAVRGEEEMLTLAEIAERYRALEEQGKVGKA